MVPISAPDHVEICPSSPTSSATAPDAFLDALEHNLHSWTWSMPEATRVRAAAEDPGLGGGALRPAGAASPPASTRSSGAPTTSREPRSLPARYPYRPEALRTGCGAEAPTTPGGPRCRSPRSRRSGWTASSCRGTTPRSTCSPTRCTTAAAYSRASGRTRPRAAPPCGTSDEHLKRLFRSAKLYHMEIPFSQEALVQATKDVIRANGLDLVLHPAPRVPGLR